MQGVGDLKCVRCPMSWAVRDIDLVARDFDALPLTARTLVEHLQSRALADEPRRAAA